MLRTQPDLPVPPTHRYPRPGLQHLFCSPCLSFRLVLQFEMAGPLAMKCDCDQQMSLRWGAPEVAERMSLGCGNSEGPDLLVAPSKGSVEWGNLPISSVHPQAGPPVSLLLRHCAPHLRKLRLRLGRLRQEELPRRHWHKECVSELAQVRIVKNHINFKRHPR